MTISRTKSVKNMAMKVLKEAYLWIGESFKEQIESLKKD